MRIIIIISSTLSSPSAFQQYKQKTCDIYKSIKFIGAINLTGMLFTLFFRILCNLPNTYTFSKSLAEHVVKDLGEDLPVVIYRPSIGECLIVMLLFRLCSSHRMC
jgi:fatty acyl-CoA reductase